MRRRRSGIERVRDKDVEGVWSLPVRIVGTKWISDIVMINELVMTHLRRTGISLCETG